MANQAIALQARAPQAPSLSGVIQQNAMLINQAMQAQAAQRQSQAKQQEMQLAREKNTREASDAQIKYAGEVAKVFKEELAMLPPGDVRGAEALRRMTVERVPGWDAILPSADAIANDKGTRRRLLMKADEIISYTTPKPVASAQQDAEGNFYGVTVGGLGAPTAEKVVITPTLPEAKAPPASPQKIIDDGVAAILEGAGVNDPRLQNLDEKQFREIQSRASQQLLAKPISYEPGAVSEVEPLTLENAPQIVQAALDSGFIDPTHVEQLKQMLPPENQAAVDQWVQQSGLKMGKGVPGAQSAVYRPQQADFGAAVADDGMAFGGPQAPFAQQIVNEPGTQFRGKPPTQAPETAIPGSAKVPLKRVREEAAAQRKTPQETYEETRSTKQAESDVKFLDGIGAARESAQTALGVISSMIGDLQVVNGQITQGKRPPHPGFEDVIGATWRPGARFISGTNAADFDAYLEQVEGGAFLEAYERLKGTGQITEVEGQKATRAITRMKRSVSEPEFVKAAREFEGIIRSALARADEREARLKGVSPRATGTPTKRGRNIDDLLKQYGG